MKCDECDEEATWAIISLKEERFARFAMVGCEEHSR